VCLAGLYDDDRTPLTVLKGAGAIEFRTLERHLGDRFHKTIHCQEVFVSADRTGDHKSSEVRRNLSQRQQVQGAEPVVARELLVAKFLTKWEAAEFA
jgi:hypothetical protein